MNFPFMRAKYVLDDVLIRFQSENYSIENIYNYTNDPWHIDRVHTIHNVRGM